MLLCGIVNELKKSIAATDLLSYFFCQATDSLELFSKTEKLALLQFQVLILDFC